jgi:superfamily II DNA or RNA helicase
VITPADEVALKRLVGSATFARGSAYARRGAVRSLVWGADGARVAGEIQGAAAEPYQTEVELTRSPSERLSALHATCTCPVGVNCKHAVALLLVKDAPTGCERRAAAPAPALRSVPPLPEGPGEAEFGRPKKRRPALPDWERPLRALLGTDEQGEPEDAPQLALQFELVPARAKPGQGRKPGAIGPGIRVRPVIPGQAGQWVKNGISWMNLDYYGFRFSKTGPVRDRLRLLKEFQALSRVSAPQPVYGLPEEAIWLEAVTSRRLWDLLREARDLHVPLVGSGRRPLPVTISSSSATVSIDVTRADFELRLRARIDVDEQQVHLASSLLIGNPAHGIAWWDDPTTTSLTNSSPTNAATTPRLHLAPLDLPIDDTLRRFLEIAPVAVPDRHKEHFLGHFAPMLQRKVVVRSSDGSVELPDVAPVRVVLSLRHGEGNRVELEWTRGVAGHEWHGGLWDRPLGAQLRGAEDSLFEHIAKVLRSLPELFELTPFGERLVTTARLDGMNAVRFVTEMLPALAELAGVEIDESGLRPDYHEVTAAPVVSLNGRGSSDGDWFDLAVEVTVGGEEVPFGELFVALAEDRSHLILPSGTYFSLERQELRQLAELIVEARALHESSGDGIRLSRFQATLWEDLQHLGVVTAQASTWEASVSALANASDRIEHAPPDGLRATLRPYQEVGFNWLAFLYEHRLGGILADDMGLGKTLQALALICHTRERGLTEAPYLVVAPTSVVGNWASECRRFAPGLDAVTVAETLSRRGVPLREMAERADIVITSYGLFRLEYEQYASIGWAGLFLDEAQFAKNRNSQAYRRAKTLPVPFKVAMTGTPMENSLMDLWSLFSIAAPGLFANPERFAEYYRVPIEKQGDNERLDKLRRRIRPLMLRRTKDQVAGDLPEKREQVLELDLSPRHKKLYQTYLQRERQKVLGLLGDMTKNRFEIFRSLTLLRQASLDVSLVDPQHAGVPSTKLDALMEMLHDVVDEGHRVLVFSQFTRFLTTARQRIAADGIEHCYLDGRSRQRAQILDEFRNGSAPVFLISLKAGGFGLNLTEADYCILLDPWWNPATEAQAVDRVHRIGQTHKVMVYRLVAKDTIEEKVMALKAKKAALFANVVDGGGFESGALTAADIRGLLA